MKILTLLIALINPVEIHASPDFKIYDVYDGDTVKAILYALQPPLNKVSFRIKGIDTPEIRTKCQSEKTFGLEATAFLKDQIEQTKKIGITVYGWGKFGGRIIVDMYLDGKSVKDLMIDNGYAVEYDGKKKTFDWCKYTDRMNDNASD